MAADTRRKAGFAKLKIQNFQSLKDADLELGPVNVLCGESNAGKSALIRAIRTLLRCRFDSAYQRIGESSSGVSLEDTNGVKALYARNGKKVFYSLYDPSTDSVPRRFEKFGKDVPAEISAFFAMPELEAAESTSGLELNIQSQFDGPFLISESGFDNASIFGKLTDIDLAVKAQSALSKDIKLNSAEIKSLEASERSLSDWIASNSMIPEMEKMLCVLEEKYCAVKKKAEKAGHLRSLYGSIEQTSEVLNQLKSRLSKLEKLENTASARGFSDAARAFVLIHEQINPLSTKLERNSETLEKLKVSGAGTDIDTKIHMIRSVLHAYTTAQAAVTIHTRLIQARKAFDSINALIEHKAPLEDLYGLLTGLSEKVKSARKASAEIEEIAAKTAETEKQLSDGHTRCPVTGAFITEECFTK